MVSLFLCLIKNTAGLICFPQIQHTQKVTDNTQFVVYVLRHNQLNTRQVRHIDNDKIIGHN